MLSIPFSALAIITLIVGVPALARRRHGYSHLRDTISELGETGAKDASLATYGLFLPVALLLLGSAAAVYRYDDRVAMLALCIAIGYLVAVIAPCDPGSPMTGTLKQSIHNLGGAIEYFGGAITLWLISEDCGVLFSWCGWIVALGAFAVSIPNLPIRGLIQRFVETILFVCVTYGGWLVVA